MHAQGVFLNFASLSKGEIHSQTAFLETRWLVLCICNNAMFNAQLVRVDLDLVMHVDS